MRKDIIYALFKFDWASYPIALTLRIHLAQIKNYQTENGIKFQQPKMDVWQKVLIMLMFVMIAEDRAMLHVILMLYYWVSYWNIQYFFIDLIFFFSILNFNKQPLLFSGLLSADLVFDPSDWRDDIVTVLLTCALTFIMVTPYYLFI